MRFIRDTIDNCQSAIYRSGNSDLDDYADRLEGVYTVIYNEFQYILEQFSDLKDEIKNMEYEIRKLTNDKRKCRQ